tara:strand:+ start:95 stop:421 length:327 start_codon:yes stop_codon:yes gene_type:complete
MDNTKNTTKMDESVKTHVRTLLTLFTGSSMFNLTLIISIVEYLKENVERKDYIKIIYGNKRITKDSTYFLIDMENLENYWCLKSQIDYHLNITGKINRMDYERLLNVL